MTQSRLQAQLDATRATIVALEEELAETNKGLLALAMELETRVEERTNELRTIRGELEQAHRELAALATELENRVAQRTAELKAREEELAMISQQLWQAEKLATVGELAASIAHELNNPLGTVSLRVESLMAQMPPDSPQYRSLAIIEQEIDRMSNLLGGLLEFSRRGSPRPSSLDVRDEVASSLELIQYHLRKRGVAVEQTFDQDLPNVWVDRQQLRQLFLNLITNAKDAMPQGGTLTIGAYAKPGNASGTGSEPEQVVIEIADTGTGIAPEHLPKVMEPFFTTKPNGKGTGLGLAICRRIVEEHGGSIEISSASGEGTTVRITLPAASRGCGN
ncbi:MAG: sensor histidine kinase [Sphingomonadaceae bacterium]